eukprot:SAG22_NODE_1287_length_4872_cov_2.731615_1_plen_404_part_00
MAAAEPEPLPAETPALWGKVPINKVGAAMVLQLSNAHEASFVRDGLIEADFPTQGDDGRTFAGVSCTEPVKAGELLLRVPLECCCRPISAGPAAAAEEAAAAEAAEAAGLRLLAKGLSDGASDNPDSAGASIDIDQGVVELVLRVLLSSGELWDLYREKLDVYRSPIPEAFSDAELDALQYDKLKDLVIARRAWVERTVERLPWAEAGFAAVGRDQFLKALHFVRSRAFAVHQLPDGGEAPLEAGQPGRNRNYIGTDDIVVMVPVVDLVNHAFTGGPFFAFVHTCTRAEHMCRAQSSPAGQTVPRLLPGCPSRDGAGCCITLLVTSRPFLMCRPPLTSRPFLMCRLPPLPPLQASRSATQRRRSRPTGPPWRWWPSTIFRLVRFWLVASAGGQWPRIQYAPPI